MRDKVFVCYSHKDKQYLNELKKALSLLIRENILILWDDSKIKPGDLWRDAITKQLDLTRVAVMLVSHNFFDSKFIMENEFPTLLKASEENFVKLIWIPVSASLYEYTPLADVQAAFSPATPLDSLDSPSRNTALVIIANVIKEAYVTTQ